MTNTRAKKVENVALDVPLQQVDGPETGDLLVLSWGGTYGACRTATEACREEGLTVAHAHLRWLNPFPRNLGDILKKYKRVLIPELNSGQLRTLIRAKYLIDAQGYSKVQGRPFAVQELINEIRKQLGLTVAAPKRDEAPIAELAGTAADAG